MAFSSRRQTAINVVKFALAAALLFYLIVQAQRHESFRNLVHQPKKWSLLAGAVGIMTVVACLTFARWFLLVRALDLPFTMKDAFRLGTLGFVLNFVSLGSVGGDLFKALVMAREQHGRKTEAVATVIFDRVVGLYALLLLAAVAILASGVRSTEGAVAVLCNIALLFTVIATAGLGLMFVSALTNARMQQRAHRIRFFGGTLARLLGAARAYRAAPGVVALCILMSLGVHTLLAVAILCIAHGLPGDVPSASDHFVLVPLGLVAGAIPATPNGLGTFEATIEYLYQLLGKQHGVVDGTGTIVALGYRLGTIAVAGFAAAYYLLVSGKLPQLDDDLVEEEIVEQELEEETEGG